MINDRPNIIKEVMTKNNSKENDNGSTSQPSDDTRTISPLYYKEAGDDSNQNDDDKIPLIDKKPKKNLKKRRNGILQSLPGFIVQKRLINLRSLLLATSLALTLFVFWLLDSLKDPTFVTMVEGNLKKHQPLAKMASVGGTLVLVILMEVITNGRKKRQNSGDNLITDEDEIKSGGGTWTKMMIGSDGEQAEEDCSATNKIPITIFRTVGLAYIFVFGVLSYFISLHPEFRGDSDITIDSSNELERNSAWYYLLGYSQYIIIESYGSISVATFWSFTNSTLTLKAAKIYYGFIIAVAQVGAIGGSTMATLKNVSIPKLFNLACIGILLQIGTMHVYGRYFPYPMSQEDDVVFCNDEDIHDYEAEHYKKSSRTHRSKQQTCTNRQVPGDVRESERVTSAKMFLSGVFLILKYNYLLLVLGVSCLYEVSLTCLDYEMKLIGLDRFTAPTDVIGDINEAYAETESTVDAFSTFMGRYGQLTNLLSLLLSYFLFPYLMENHGLKHTLRIFPSLLLVIMFMTFVALPMNLPVLFMSMSILKAMTYSINDPAKEILYIPTSNVVKFKAKFWIDVVGARIAKAIGSSINTYAGTAERIVQYGSLPSVVTAVALWLVCYAAGMKFDELLEKGEIVGLEEDEANNAISLYSYEEKSDEDNVSMNENYSNDYMSESGWESNVTVEIIHLKSDNK